MRAALHDGDGLVVNVLELPDDYDADDPAAFQPPAGYSLLVLADGSPVAPGWTVDGDSGEPPPQPEPDPSEPRPTCETLAAEVLELRDQVAALREALQSLTSGAGEN